MAEALNLASMSRRALCINTSRNSQLQVLQSKERTDNLGSRGQTCSRMAIHADYPHKNTHPEPTAGDEQQ